VSRSQVPLSAQARHGLDFFGGGVAGQVCAKLGGVRSTARRVRLRASSASATSMAQFDVLGGAGHVCGGRGEIGMAGLADHQM
jgi:hypothetical protein